MGEVIQGRFQPLSIEVQAALTEQHGLETLLFCPNAWALRHRFVNTETGETVRARCGSWSCLYCGPRKVDLWRQLIKAAEPTLFITLTQVGKTLKEAARVLTTVLQYLRRGSKGRGKNHLGARPAYPIEVFAILEEHSDFEHVGFHWHLLVKGVDFLPNQVVSDALRSATKGRSYITKTERVRNNKAIGYVTKYLMKEIARERRGMVEEQVTRPVLSVEDGKVVQEEVMVTVERLCKAHRIRYSRHFFPEKTADLRRRLFGEQEETSETQLQPHKAGADEQGEERIEETVVEVPIRRSSWVLYEAEPVIDDNQVYERRRVAALVGGTLSIEEDETSLEAYRRRRREALLEALLALREGRRLYSRRVIRIWAYQRGQLQLAG